MDKITRNMGLKVNWHFIHRCNFSCKYCFVKPLPTFEVKDLKLLDILSRHFSEINLVGGEPTISDDFGKIIEYAKNIFDSVSMVTNGYKISKDSFNIDLSQFKTIGVSIDFFDKENNIKIGRCRSLDDALSFDEYKIVAKKIKAAGAEFKINLMVSTMNMNMNFDKFLRELKPDRLKILGVMDVFGDENTKKLQPSKEEFLNFVNTHHFNEYCNDVVIEGLGEMVDAYIMVTGDGDLLTDSNFEKKVLGNFFKENSSELLSKLNLDLDKYKNRYSKKYD